MIKNETLTAKLTEHITAKEKMVLDSAIKNIEFKGF
jgi:hypothetical protein